MYEVLTLIEETDDGLSISSMLRLVNLSQSRVEKCIKLMEIEGAVFKSGSKYYRSTNPWQPDEDRINRVTALRYEELKNIQDFINADKCYMKMVAEELDDPYAQACGKCANCQEPFFPYDVD